MAKQTRGPVQCLHQLSRIAPSLRMLVRAPTGHCPRAREVRCSLSGTQLALGLSCGTCVGAKKAASQRDAEKAKKEVAEPEKAKSPKAPASGGAGAGAGAGATRKLSAACRLNATNHLLCAGCDLVLMPALVRVPHARQQGPMVVCCRVWLV